MQFFVKRKQATKQIIDLVCSVTLGTSGSRYKHLDTAKRILEIDNPLFLSLERNHSTLANVTFCQRDNFSYVRYFAFDERLQSSGTRQTSAKNGLLKKELQNYFESEVKNGITFYAYIDPRNEKSLWMSETFGFSKQAVIATQTFSRIKPVHNAKLELTAPTPLKGDDLDFKYAYNTPDTRTYTVEQNGKVILQSTVKTVNWKIERLPGKHGSLLTKIIPFVPFVRKIINPNMQTFLALESMFVDNASAKEIESFLSGILYAENKNVILWWVDEADEGYQTNKSGIKWGLLNKIAGVNKVELVAKGPYKRQHKSVYVNGFDFV